MSNEDTLLQTFLQDCRARCADALEQHLQTQKPLAPRLNEAMAYATLQGGKRLRPALVYASAMATGEPGELSDRAACAVELVHCYSLAHDDLPAMDDDDLRRGRPTVHRAYDEATAVLAGDALQSLAFLLLSTDDDDRAAQRLQMIHVLARASGSEGMAGGQSLDIDAAEQALSVQELETMHRLKTGALIEASVMMGALSTGLEDTGRKEALQHYASCIGLAFQVQDDILDVTGDTGTLGKTGGADAVRGKPTYTSLLGLEGACDKATALTREAVEALQHFDERADMLRRIARYITHRVH
ncbi:MAG: farnesyl diphosphate synthase [Pseudohongiellaceae bacterium]